MRAGPRVCPRFPAATPLYQVCPWVLATLHPVRRRYRALRQAVRACRACSLTDSRAIPLVCASLFCDSESKHIARRVSTSMLRSLLHTAACTAVSPSISGGWPCQPAPAARRRSAAFRVGFAAAVLAASRPDLDRPILAWDALPYRSYPSSCPPNPPGDGGQILCHHRSRRRQQGRS